MWLGAHFSSWQIASGYYGDNWNLLHEALIENVVQLKAFHSLALFMFDLKTTVSVYNNSIRKSD